jgi:hypothetical protein
MADGNFGKWPKAGFYPDETVKIWFFFCPIGKWRSLENHIRDPHYPVQLSIYTTPDNPDNPPTSSYLLLIFLVTSAEIQLDTIPTFFIS